MQKNHEIHKTKPGADKIIRFDQKLFREDEETLDYSDYDEPEAAALMRVEILDEEEKTGPTLGRVLGAQEIPLYPACAILTTGTGSKCSILGLPKDF